MVNTFNYSVHNDDDNDAHLTAVFQDNPSKPVPECLYSGFHWS